MSLSDLFDRTRNDLRAPAPATPPPAPTVSLGATPVLTTAPPQMVPGMPGLVPIEQASQDAKDWEATYAGYHTGMPRPDEPLRAPHGPAVPPPRGVPFGGNAAPASGPNFQPPALPPGIDPNLALALARQGTGGPAVVRPEHWSPTTRQTQVTHGIPLSEKTEKAFTDYQKAQQEGAKAGTELAMAQLAEDARQKSALATFDAARTREHEELRQWQTDQLNTQRGHIENLLNEANSQAIDPNKWWHEKSGFGKVMTGLTMALRGFNFGLNGRGEDPATWVNQQVAQSVAAQQAQFAQTRAKVGDATNLYGLMRDRFGDEDKARQATTLALRQNLISSLQAKAADQQLPAEQRLRASQIAEKLAGPQFEDRRKLEESIADHVVTHGAEQFHERQVVGGGGMDPLRLAKRALELKKTIDELNGSDPATVKERSALTKEWAETQILMGKLAPGGVDKEQLERLAQQTEAGGLPGARVAINEARDLIDRGGLGDLPGTKIPAQRALAADVPGVRSGFMEGVPVLGSIPWPVATPAQRRLDSVITSVAEAQARATGRATPELIGMFKHQIIGNASRADILAGLASAEKTLNARQATIRSGVSPEAQTEYSRRMQAAGFELPPGFRPGVADEE